jgi:hypothetical protein
MSTPTFTDLDVEFGRFTDLERKFGIKRSTAYALIQQGKIKSRYVRLKGSRAGVQLIDFQSVRELLATAPEKPTAAVEREMYERALASVAKRAANGGNT